MRVHAVYRDLLAVPPALPPAAFWSAFVHRCYKKHRPVFDGLIATYGPELLGPNALMRLVMNAGPLCRAAIGRLISACPGEAESRCADLLSGCWLPAWGDPPDCYLGTLFGLAPAAAITVRGRPSMVIGLERFVPGDDPDPGATPEAATGRTYHLADLAEMIPHEAAHAARSQALRLSLTPTRLALLDLLLLEGTALWYTDARLGKLTLLSFLPRAAWERHQAREEQLLSTLVPTLAERGASVFRRHFAGDCTANGYYLGWAICRRYLERQGGDATAMTTVPSADILAGAGLAPGAPA